MIYIQIIMPTTKGLLTDHSDLFTHKPFTLADTDPSELYSVYSVSQRTKLLFRWLYALVLAVHIIVMPMLDSFYFFIDIFKYLSLWGAWFSFIYFVLAICYNNDTKVTRSLGLFYGISVVINIQTTVLYWVALEPFKGDYPPFPTYYYRMIHVYPLLYLVADYFMNKIIVNEKIVAGSLAVIITYGIYMLGVQLVMIVSIYGPYNFSNPYFTHLRYSQGYPLSTLADGC